MRKLTLAILAIILLVGTNIYAEEKPINGIMIDCARLLEKHDYYYRLVDFMSDWDMNTLLLHFSDDHGISIALPGYEKLAHPEAFSLSEIHDLVVYAEEKGIDVIPELEVFGHARYITDHPDYYHLYVGDRSKRIVFNAVDPLNPETIELMRSMLSEVARLFPSDYLHLGCDEVNLSGLGLNDKEKEAQIWVDYVNQMNSITRDLGKIPMIWSDHVRKDPGVADHLDKNVVLVEWNYSPEYTSAGLDGLRDRGFKNIIMAPSVSCWRNRAIPSEPQLKNVDAHASAVLSGKANGMLNTVWLPMRYLQNSMWYGMAYGAWIIENDKPMNLKKFHRAFFRKTFDLSMNKKMNAFLCSWVKLHLDRQFFSAIANQDFTLLKDPARIGELKDLYDRSSEILSDPLRIGPPKHPEILESMYLSTEIIQVLSEGLLIIAKEEPFSEQEFEFLTQLEHVVARAESEWDRGRFPDDPAKYRAKFPNQTNSHLLVVLRELKTQIINQ